MDLILDKVLHAHVTVFINIILLESLGRLLLSFGTIWKKQNELNSILFNCNDVGRERDDIIYEMWTCKLDINAVK